MTGKHTDLLDLRVEARMWSGSTLASKRRGSAEYRYLYALQLLQVSIGGSLSRDLKRLLAPSRPGAARQTAVSSRAQST